MSLWALLVCDVLLSGGVVAGWLGAHVPPHRVWWLQPIASALPILALLLACCAFGSFSLLQQGKALFVSLHLPVALLVALRFLPLSVGTAAVEDRPAKDVSTNPRLRVVTFNAHNNRLIWYHIWRAGLREREPASARQATLQELAHWQPPDFACIQEAPDDLVREWPGAQYHPAAGLALVPVHAEASPSAVFRRTRPQTASVVAVDSFYSHYVLHWYGREISVYNVQLHSFVSKPWQVGPRYVFRLQAWREQMHRLRRDYLLRAREARHLRTLLMKDSRPFIVCGDLNSTPHNWAYRIIADGLQDAASTRLWRGRATNPAGFPLVRIDHILTSRHWKVLSVDTESTELSDHRALAAYLVLGS